MAQARTAASPAAADADGAAGAWDTAYEWKAVTLLGLGFGLVGLDRWIGLVVGSGEIFGGGIAPSIGGFIAQHYGIENVLFVALAGVVFGMLVCLFLEETAPRKLAIEGVRTTGS